MNSASALAVQTSGHGVKNSFISDGVFSPSAVNEHVASLRRQVEVYRGLNHHLAWWAPFMEFCVVVPPLLRRKRKWSILANADVRNILWKIIAHNSLTISFGGLRNFTIYTGISTLLESESKKEFNQLYLFIMLSSITNENKNEKDHFSYLLW